MTRLTKLIQYNQTETVEDFDETSLDSFEKELIAAVTIAMGLLSDTPEGVQGLRKAKESIKTQPSIITGAIKSLNHYALTLLAISNSGQGTLELSNGWDLDTRGAAELLVEGSRVFTQLQEGKLIV